MTTSPLIIPVARFFDASGNPLAGGFVYTYAAGTDTPKASYTDFGGQTPNTNPVELDMSGQAAIWLDGNYKINLTDSDDVQQANYPVDNVSSISTGSISEYAVTTGTANAYLLAPAPAIVAYTAGVAFNIKINVSNSGPSTINVSNLGTKSIVVAPNYPLAGGELLADNIYRIVYDGTNFQVLNPTPPIEITMGITATAPWGRLPMNGTVTVAKTSGATYNSSIYERVYTYLWTNYSNAVAPVSTGRGASAAADFAANKNITIPDHADYIMLGVSSAGLITAPGATVGASTVISTGSIVINAVTLTSTELPAHKHFGYAADVYSGGTHTTNQLTNNQQVASVSLNGTDSVNYTMEPTNTASTVGLTSSTGSGSAFTPTGSYTGNATSVVQKSRGIYFYISY